MINVKEIERRSNLKFKDGYREGIKAVAEFVGTWDKQIAGTPYMFEDIILKKFNLIERKKLRRKKF